jgi:chaperonin GroES
MTLKPLGDKIVTKMIEVETVSKGGILLTGSAKEKPDYAEVIAVGPGAYNNEGKLIPMEVNVGDKIMMAKYAGTEVKLEGVEYTITKQSDVLAIVTD